MTTLLLATTGGHLEQLDQLSRRLPGDGACVWVTHANEQSRSLLAGRTVEFVPYVRSRNVPDVARCVPTAHRLLRDHRIDRAVSTGSGIALGYLPYLAARGVECHYIESAARVAEPSLTGRLLAAVPGVWRYTQYPHATGRRWGYGGSVLDRFAPATRPEPTGPVLRVVVTVGTATEFPFSRLLRALVPVLAPGGALASLSGRRIEVFWQTGCAVVEDASIEARPFVDSRRMAAALAGADVVIAHAGVGSALGILEAGVHPVLVPRRASYGEAADDHQVQLVAELQRRGLATSAEPASLTPELLLETLTRGVRRPAEPAPFELRS